MLELPGVDAQEKTKEEIIESLRIGAEEVLATQVSFEPQTTLNVIYAPEPTWAAS